MTTMLGGKRNKNLIDFLSDPDKARAAIQSHKEATIAHAIAADNYKKHKADALEEIERLRQAKEVHQETEKQLADKHQAIIDLQSQVSKRSYELDVKDVALTEEKARFDEMRLGHQDIMNQFKIDLSQHENMLDIRRRDLKEAEDALAEKLDELKNREDKIVERENAIINLANILRT